EAELSGQETVPAGGVDDDLCTDFVSPFTVGPSHYAYGSISFHQHIGHRPFLANLGAGCDGIIQHNLVKARAVHVICPWTDEVLGEFSGEQLDLLRAIEEPKIDSLFHDEVHLPQPRGHAQSLPQWPQRG